MRHIIAILAFSIISLNTTQAATVSIESSTGPIGVSDVLSLDILGSDFTSTSGGGVNLFYDASVVNVLSVSIDNTVWNFTNSLGTIDNSSGEVSDILVSVFPSLIATDFTMASIEFIAVGEGTTSLLLTDSILNPWSVSGMRLDPLFLEGSITVSAVPVPAALLLFISGIATLTFTAKRKDKMSS